MDSLAAIKQAEQYDKDRGQQSLDSLSASSEVWVLALLNLAASVLEANTESDGSIFTPQALKCCKDAGNAHIEWYDESSTGEKLSAMISAPLHRLVLSSHHAQFRFYSRATNKLKNITADTFANRTSEPHFVSEKHTYPARTVEHNPLSRYLDGILFRFHGPRSTKRQDVAGNWRLLAGYLDISNALNVLTKSRVTEALRMMSHQEGAQGQVPEWAANPQALMSRVYQNKWISKTLGAGMSVPEPRPNLGREFHVLSEVEAAVQLVCVAVLGSRHGLAGWRRFNRVLIQGAWPWLIGYDKTYAKAVFAILISLYVAIEQGKIIEGAAIGLLMIEIAKGLVRRDGADKSGLRICATDRLKGEKVRVQGVVEAKPKQKEDEGSVEEVESGVVMKNKEAAGSLISLKLKSKASRSTLVTVSDVKPDKPDDQKDAEGDTPASQADKSKKDEEVKGWTLSEADAPVPPMKTLPSHIIPGVKCNHGDNVPYSGRLRVAHCLEELEKNLEDENGITVAQTLGNEDARDEIARYAVEGRILSVKRGEGQCIYCAYKLAHCVGALIVIG